MSECYCWKSNIEHTEEVFGINSYEHEAALNRPATCLLLDGHDGPHEFTFDGDIQVTFAKEN